MTQSRPLEERLREGSARDGACLVWQRAPNRNGYGTIKVRGRKLFVHRVAWSMNSGEEVPAGMVIDHACGVRLCIEPGHLRVVTRAENNQHRTRPHVHNTSGHRGVSFNKELRKWSAYCQMDGVLHGLGLYDTADEAGAVARAFRDRHYSLPDHEEWMRNNYYVKDKK